jgi:hypothetical protein
MLRIKSVCFTLSVTLALVLASESAIASASSPQLNAVDGVCQIVTESTEGLAGSLQISEQPCAVLETAGLIVRAGGGFKLSNLALAMGTSLRDKLEYLLKINKRSQPYIEVKLLGQTKTVQLSPDGTATLAGETAFSYAGSCYTQQDIRAMHNVSKIAEVEMAAAARPTHTPGKNDNISLRSGAWVYDLSVRASYTDAAGDTTLTFSGTSAGPTNFNKEATRLCNGYKPTFESVELHSVTARLVAGKGYIRIPGLGDVALQLYPN